MYKVASAYSTYKENLLSYSNNVETSIMPGCESFTVQQINIPKEDFPKLCSTVVKYLNNLKENSDTYRDEGCKYLYYWLYVEKLQKNTTIPNTLTLYKELNNIFNKDNEGLNNLDNYINEMNENTSDKIVKLTELYEKFYQFMLETRETSREKKCTSDCFNLYTSYVNECRNGDDTDFCYELTNFRNQYNAYIQTQLFCKGEEYLLPPVHNFDVIGIIIIPIILILVTPFIFSLLYKFMPIGTWLPQQIGIRKNIVDNINDEENHLFNNYDMDTQFSKKRNYIIAYNS
ncbi:Plasmodium vivax Vir protein, putative [Plasmodium ovale]|uniref:Plasmodium vivax Vir protein, putative n=1 Tax=Plasmodium ovale TaxID=36330 RepID=A0A1C3KJC8_PLAOA|nr:Plasmodium vivax Vir protein, putative [Plasmodium ovale]